MVYYFLTFTLDYFGSVCYTLRWLMKWIIVLLKIYCFSIVIGGGVPESERAKELSKQLGVDILPLQVLLLVGSWLLECRT